MVVAPETKACTRCEIEQPVESFSRDSARKSGIHPWCNACRKESARKRIAANPEFHRKRVAAWRAKNPDADRAIRKSQQVKHKEKRNAESRAYRAANLDRVRLLGREWSKNNPAASRAINNARRAAKKRAIPAWASDELDQFVMSECYSLAVKRTQITGVEWHVDHVVPLRSENVCGLHCSANLQVIPARLNHAKGNRVWPDMP